MVPVALETSLVGLLAEVRAALAVLLEVLALLEVLVALVVLPTFLVDLVAVLQAVLEAKLLEATLLLPAMLLEPLPLALQVLLVPQAERVVRRVVLLPVLPVLVRVTPQPL